jgi:hypothetical protein
LEVLVVRSFVAQFFLAFKDGHVAKLNMLFDNADIHLAELLEVVHVCALLPLLSQLITKPGSAPFWVLCEIRLRLLDLIEVGINNRLLGCINRNPTIEELLAFLLSDPQGTLGWRTNRSKEIFQFGSLSLNKSTNILCVADCSWHCTILARHQVVVGNTLQEVLILPSNMRSIVNRETELAMEWLLHQLLLLSRWANKRWLHRPAQLIQALFCALAVAVGYHVLVHRRQD